MCWREWCELQGVVWCITLWELVLLWSFLLGTVNDSGPKCSLLSHKRAICDKASCKCALMWSIFFFPKRKNFDPPGSSNKTLSRSGLLRSSFCALLVAAGSLLSSTLPFTCQTCRLLYVTGMYSVCRPLTWHHCLGSGRTKGNRRFWNGPLVLRFNVYSVWPVAQTRVEVGSN